MVMPNVMKKFIIAIAMVFSLSVILPNYVPNMGNVEAASYNYGGVNKVVGTKMYISDANVPKVYRIIDLTSGGGIALTVVFGAILALSGGTAAPLVMAFIGFVFWWEPTALKNKIEDVAAKHRGIIIDVGARTVTSQ